MKSAEKMKSITKHVERSSQEQTRGSKQITRAIESISEMVGQLNNAHREQTRGAEQILMAVDSMRDLMLRQQTHVHAIREALAALAAVNARMQATTRETL
jgi:methyl-accepting chemotaxis protein